MRAAVEGCGPRARQRYHPAMVRRGRWLTILGVCVIPCAIAAGWAGCATADEEVEGTPRKNPGGGDTAGGGDGDDPGDDGGGAGDGSGGGEGGGGEGGGAGSVCTDASRPNSCADATDVGKIALGTKKSVSASVPPTGGDLWFKITYENLADRKAHPRVQITPGDTPLAFQVVKNCAAEEFMCGEEAPTKSSKVKDFELQYVPEGGVVDARPSDAAKDTAVADTSTGDSMAPSGGDTGFTVGDGGFDAPDTFIPIKLGTDGVIYVRVFRPSGAAPGCDFKLELSN